jgi:xylan 1,4-beta-xylosidase
MPPITPLYNPCLGHTNHSSLPWCDPTLPVDVRVADMVSRIPLAEKIANLDTEAPAIPSLGLNSYNWWSEATHGVSHVNNTGSTPASTNFAFPITTTASFNRSLWHATGAAIAREARAFMNAGHAYSTYWAPVVNLAREPRWGRNLECAGEDPYLSGEYAASFVNGFEHLDEEQRYLAASACCKHYAANSMEDSRVAGVHHTRYSADPNITARDLVDSFLAPFQACVEKGRVSSLSRPPPTRTSLTPLEPGACDVRPN